MKTYTIKPLEWDDNSTDGSGLSYVGRAPLTGDFYRNIYRIDYHKSTDNHSPGWSIHLITHDLYDTLDEAKAVAEDDYIEWLESTLGDYPLITGWRGGDG